MKHQKPYSKYKHIFKCGRYLGPDFGEAAAGAGGGEAVRAADVPKLAQQSFPLCMALMTQHLHADRHLKHGGRMQLNLFLKVRAGGVSLYSGQLLGVEEGTKPSFP